MKPTLQSLVFTTLLLGATPALATESTAPALLARVHSHNDYRRAHPLFDALEQGFSSVEADIWWHRGRIMISHIGLSFTGSLQELYLDPLQKIVDRQGSVLGDGRVFYLWIDLKQGSSRLRHELDRLLSKYPMLTTYSDKGTSPGSVSVILTGDSCSKKRFIEEHPVRRATRDGSAYTETDPPADDKWQWYAIAWHGWMKRPGALRWLADGIHSKGRKVWLYGVPRTEWIWRDVLDSGVDQLSVDNLPWMRRFIDNYGPQSGKIAAF